MAMVVVLAPIVAEESHGVVFDNVFREMLGEVFDRVPQGWNGLNVLVQAEDEAVFFAIVLHELERVVMNIAEELNAGLDSPVPFVVEHKGMAEEEARLVTAHVSV